MQALFLSASLFAAEPVALTPVAQAKYSLLADGSIEVLNTCVKPDGTPKSVLGAAKVVDKVSNAKLMVTFLPSWLRWTVDHSKGKAPLLLGPHLPTGALVAVATGSQAAQCDGDAEQAEQAAFDPGFHDGASLSVEHGCDGAARPRPGHLRPVSVCFVICRPPSRRRSSLPRSCRP